jgi:hypothetical protein
MTYMLNRRQQIGVSYSYGTYYLTKDFGEAEVQAATFIYGRVLSRRWYLNLGVGTYQADSIRLQQVAVDPFIALLTGQTQTLEVFNGRRRGFSGRAEIAGRFRRATVNLAYNRGISPGNGVYFIAETETVSAGAGYETRRRFSMNGQAEWMRFKAVTQNIGNAVGYGGNFQAAYRLNKFLHLRASAHVYRWDINGAFFGRDRFFATLGLAYSPGELPLTLW